MTDETEPRRGNGADGLVTGILDVMAGLAMALCHVSKIEPRALAKAMVDATNSTITPLTPPEYASGRRYAAARIAETLCGLGLPKEAKAAAWPGFEVILGGLAGAPKADTPPETDDAG